MPLCTDVPHCRLVTYVARGQRRFDVAGHLERVSQADREKLADVLRRHLGLTHDEAYALLWNEVPPCLLSPTPRF